jgi:hypothetical protein
MSPIRIRKKVILRITTSMVQVASLVNARFIDRLKDQATAVDHASNAAAAMI